MKKVTPAMLGLVDAMRRGVRAHYLGGVNAYYFRSDTMRACTRQVLGLIDRGLAVPDPEGITLATPEAAGK